MDIPIFELYIDETNYNTGINSISFVDEAATDVKWFLFNNENKDSFYKMSEDKRIITAPVMIPDQLIQKYNDSIGYFYIKFSRETIEATRRRFFKENKIHTLDEQHNYNNKINNVYLIESYIIDSHLKNTLFSELPIGTWMVSYFVEDVNYWTNVIKSDKFTGISLDGNFYDKLVDFEELILEKTKKILNNNNISDDEKWNTIKKILNNKK